MTDDTKSTLLTTLIVVISAIMVLQFCSCVYENKHKRDESAWCASICDPLNVKSCDNWIAVCGDYTIRKQ